MMLHGAVELVVFVSLVLALGWPLGLLLDRVLRGRSSGEASPVAAGSYVRSVLVFGACSFALLYAILRLQHRLPMGEGRSPMSPALAFNTAVSFVTNTNWQAYSGEVALSNVSQMVGLAVQNFLSAGTGLAVMAALCRALAPESRGLGDFRRDLFRVTLAVLLPLSFLLAILLVMEGVPQTFTSSVPFRPLGVGAEGASLDIPLGPVASQVAIKQLGTNGGGFYGVNSAHPLENPTPLSNLLEMLAILVLPASCCITFGRMVGDRRQGRLLLMTMTALFLVCALSTIACEIAEPEVASAPTIAARLDRGEPSWNAEGKETRFGAVDSAIWATATTAASNGSVNAMHDSFSALGGFVPLLLIQLGEVVFGGVGSGLYGMILFVLVAVFIAGLMVGRAPEYLGKKIEPFEMKMAAVGILLPCITTLVVTALGAAIPDAARSATNAGPHGFTQMLYAASSAANNNGSAFAGFVADTPFWNTALGIAMLVGRYGVIVPVLAIAESMARKRSAPPSNGTLPTHTPLFGFFLAAIILIVGALTFLPSLALGPLAEFLGGAR